MKILPLKLTGKYQHFGLIRCAPSNQTFPGVTQVLKIDVAHENEFITRSEHFDIKNSRLFSREKQKWRVRFRILVNTQ